MLHCNIRPQNQNGTRPGRHQKIRKSAPLRHSRKPLCQSRRDCGLIRQGEEVRILDARTGKDLTRVTLTQIITEDAKDKPTGLPLELLRQLVVASDESGRNL